MDIQTGQIYDVEELRKLDQEFKSERIRPIQRDLLGREIRERKIGRNAPCGCGSGRKFKRCCLNPFNR